MRIYRLTPKEGSWRKIIFDSSPGFQIEHGRCFIMLTDPGASYRVEVSDQDVLNLNRALRDRSQVLSVFGDDMADGDFITPT